MTLFPIFVIGVLTGAILTYLVMQYKRETPSETKFHIQEAKIISLTEDLKTMEKLNDKLYERIDELKKKIK